MRRKKNGKGIFTMAPPPGSRGSPEVPGP